MTITYPTLTHTTPNITVNTHEEGGGKETKREKDGRDWGGGKEEAYLPL
jgi:hypothetical protein